MSVAGVFFVVAGVVLGLAVYISYATAEWSNLAYGLLGAILAVGLGFASRGGRLRSSPAEK